MRRHMAALSVKFSSLFTFSVVDTQTGWKEMGYRKRLRQSVFLCLCVQGGGHAWLGGLE